MKTNSMNIHKAVAYQIHSIVSHSLMKNKNGAITLFAFDKDEELSEHTSSSDALVQVLEGAAEVMLSGEWHQLKPGDALYLPANEPHAVKAVERFKMQLTTIKPV